jgi:phytoene/squalene synthetase
MQEFKVYCRYVAGTVGNMLTDLFVQKDKSLPEQALRKNATDFGKYLQTINILKDPVEDWIEEKAVFIPEKELEKGKTHEDLIGILEYPEWSKGEILMEGMANMLGYAGNKRNDALEYVQEVPDSEIRRYLEVPYLLAVATENLARNEPERALDQELSIDIGKVSKILGFREEGTSFEDIRGELHSEPETVKTDSEIDPEILPKEAFPQPFPPVSRPDPE